MTLDIYRFIDSADVRDYLEEKQYAFSPLEAAFVVWQSRAASLEEKHAAWSEIIETMPDTNIPYEKWKAPRESLHAFLRDYMALEDRLLREFYDPTGFCAYNYYEPEYYAEPENCDLLVDHRGIFHELDTCLAAARKALEGYDEQEIIIYRIDLTYGHRLHAAFCAAGDVLRVRPEYELFEPEEAILQDSFITLTDEISFMLPFLEWERLYDEAKYDARDEEDCSESAEKIQEYPEQKSSFPENARASDRVIVNGNGEKNELVLLVARLAAEYGFPFRFISPDIGLPPQPSDGFYGIPQLDRNSIGNYTSDLIGLASFGGAAALAKDDFLLSNVLHHAVDRQESVLFFSMHLKTSEVWRRLLKLLSGCDPAFVDGASAEELDRLWNAYFMLLSTWLTVIDAQETDAEAVECQLKNAHPALVVIDSLQRFNPIPELEDQRERVQYAQIAYGLKQLAKKYNVPILLTAGLPWPPDFIPGQQPEPTLRDFNRTVNNADFDQILLVHAERGSNAAKISLVKNRYGDCTTTNLTVIK